jgi:hypothetical protein
MLSSSDHIYLIYTELVKGCYTNKFMLCQTVREEMDQGRRFNWSWVTEMHDVAHIIETQTQQEYELLLSRSNATSATSNTLGILEFVGDYKIGACAGFRLEVDTDECYVLLEDNGMHNCGQGEGWGVITYEQLDEMIINWERQFLNTQSVRLHSGYRMFGSMINEMKIKNNTKSHL